ncbi:MAG: pyruvate kinase [Dehalococcoidia bacterium]
MKLAVHHKTKIVCTIGPATESTRMLDRLVRAGMNVARINLSHGDEKQHSAIIRAIRAVAKRLEAPVAVLIDIPGPRYRTGDLKDGQVSLKRGSRLVLTSRKVPGDQHEVSLNLPNLVQDVVAGDSILLDDGAIRLTVRQTTDTDILCGVAVGGVLKPRRGIAAPGVKLSAPFVTGETQRHLEFAAENQAEYVALSFVSRRSDVSQVKAIMAETGGIAALIAKIERREAVRNFDRILKVSDGIMVARGDLGVDMALEKVPLVQKQIIRKCNRAGKPVITATQMLESMTRSSRPTRAEVADVANAIYDGTDAVMLSAESAIGEYPVEAVRVMVRIARETEAALPYERRFAERASDLEPHTDDAIAYAACHTAHQLCARAIVAFTESGSTTWRVCKYRPRVPILAITPSDTVQRKLALAWGVYPYQIPAPSDVDDMFSKGRAVARELGVVEEGDLVVITGGVPIGVTGTTNLLKVEIV